MVVTCDRQIETFDFSKSSSLPRIQFAAFYRYKNFLPRDNTQYSLIQNSNCVYEVQPITEGTQVTITYLIEVDDKIKKIYYEVEDDKEDEEDKEGDDDDDNYNDDYEPIINHDFWCGPAYRVRESDINECMQLLDGNM